MKIVNPEYQLVDRRGMTLSRRIEMFGRTAYQSWDKLDDTSDRRFCEKHAAHRSTFEGACMHLLVLSDYAEEVSYFLRATDKKYLMIESLKSGGLLISGTVRALQEWINGDTGIGMRLQYFLHEFDPLLFPNFPGDGYSVEKSRTDVISVPPAAVVDLSAYPDKHLMVMVRFIVNRAVTHELVRHRPCSFLQESQRYCRYNQERFGSEVTFIKPTAFYKEGTRDYALWEKAMRGTEKIYLELLKTSTPQAARIVLPNSCKTELAMYATVAEWRHVFKLRNNKACDPSMQEIMKPLARDFFQNRIFWE